MKIFILIVSVFISSTLLAQNVGINQNSPTNSLHISPFSIGDNPIRIDGIQPYNIGDTSLLLINQSTGIVKYINTSDFVSIISNGSGFGTDSQNIDSLILTGYNLETFISNGNSASVDLNPLVDSISNSIINNSDFENQVVSILYDNADTLFYNTDFINNLRDSIDTDIDSLILNGTTLTIYENGTSSTVNLSSINDHDWYEVGGTNAPDNINDNIFTLGNVGIGIATPSAPLDLGAIELDRGNGDVSVGSDIFMSAQGLIASENNMFFNTDSDGNSSGDFYFGIGTETNAATNLMTILNNGRVGIGTINPVYKLHINNGGELIQNSDGSYGLLAFDADGNSSNIISDYASIGGHAGGGLSLSGLANAISSSHMYINNAGDVGIGTTSPSSKTHILSTATMPAFPIGTTASGHVFRVQQGGGASLFMDGNAMVSDAPTNLSIGTLLNAPIAFGTNDQTRMTITGSGDVGIGLGVPLAKFHVVGGDAYFTDQPINNFSSSRSSQAVVTDNFRAASDNGIRLYDGNSTSHLHMGSLNNSYLQAYNTSSIGPGTLGTGSLDFDDNTNFANININPLGGRVGIGTVAPTEILNVNGNIKLGLTKTGPVQPPGYGDAIIFSGAPDVSATFDGDNSDVISLTRFNAASDASELRLIIGDNNQVADAFSIGYGNFIEAFRFETAGIARKAGGGTWAATSDKRTKKEIADFSDGLNILTQINPVTFKYNGLYNTPDNGTDYVGIIAQEIQKVAPYMIGSYEATKTKDSKVKEEILNYDGGTYMLYVLVNSVKEQQLQIEELKKSNELLIEEINKLKK